MTTKRTRTTQQRPSVKKPSVKDRKPGLFESLRAARAARAAAAEDIPAANPAEDIPAASPAEDLANKATEDSTDQAVEDSADQAVEDSAGHVSAEAKTSEPARTVHVQEDEDWIFDEADIWPEDEQDDATKPLSEVATSKAASAEDDSVIAIGTDEREGEQYSSFEPAIDDPWKAENTPKPQKRGLASFVAENKLTVAAAAVALVAVCSLAGVAGSSLAEAPASEAGASIGDTGSQQPMDITVIGYPTTVPAGTTVAAALEATGVKATPGRLLAEDGSVIDEAGGKPAVIYVNDDEATMDTVLQPGNDVFVIPGEDVTGSAETQSGDSGTDGAAESSEPSEGEHDASDNSDANYKYTSVWRDDTMGSIHEVVPDEDGSGSAHLVHYSVRPSEKVVALTFDDGPWGETTSQLLDLLKEYEVHATFFVVGTTFDGDEEATALLKREIDEGHQVCSHTYTHASDAPGFRMTGLDAETQRQEVSHCQEAIAEATGTEASKVVRMPGGVYDENVAYNVQPFVSYEIGWDVDTLDWRKPGAAAIEEALWMVEPGDIVLMHDGGGDRAQTVEALRNVLPKMKEEGWKFVTIDELLALPDADRDFAAEGKPTVAIPEPEPAPEETAAPDATYSYGYGTASGTEWGYTEYGATGYGYGSTGYGYDTTGAYGSTGYGSTGYGYDTTGAYGSTGYGAAGY